MAQENETAAALFCAAIRELADRPENLENLRLYLTSHFSVWLNKYASTPEDIASELSCFARMDIQ